MTQRVTPMPHEPVTAGYFADSQWPVLREHSPRSFYGFYPGAGLPVHLTLANGQKIIVRDKQ